MGIEVPGKRWGKRLSHSKVFGHGGHGKKVTYADLLITPLVDMFVIIVLFLIANFSATGEVLMMSKDISLPEAKNVQDIQSAPVVTVSKTEVLLSGNHAAIARWRRDMALRRTAAHRPDLIAALQKTPRGLDRRDRQVLAEVGFPVNGEDMAH